MRKLKNIAVIAFIIYAMTTFINQETIQNTIPKNNEENKQEIYATEKIPTKIRNISL